MKAAQLLEKHRFDIVDVPKPDPKPDEVLIRVHACGVCRGDFDRWDGVLNEFPFAPGAPGHEVYGEIAETGSEVNGFSPGDRVTCIRFPGVGYAEFVAAKASQTLRMPDELEGAIVTGEPLACAMNAMRRSGVLPGDSVLLIGTGFMGVLALKILKNMGASPLVTLDLTPFNRELALRNGADAALDPKSPDTEAILLGTTENRGFDVVVEATGAQAALDLATEMVKIRGRLVIYGLHLGGNRSINVRRWNFKGIDVVSAHERDPDVYFAGMEKAISLLQHKRMVFDLITHRFAMDEINHGFEIIKSRPNGYIKAIVTP